MLGQVTHGPIITETMRIALDHIEKHEAHDDLEDWDILIERYYFNEVDWRHQSIGQLKTKQQQAGEDALRLIQWFQEQEDKSLRECRESKLLVRVFDEQYEMSDRGIRMRK